MDNRSSALRERTAERIPIGMATSRKRTVPPRISETVTGSARMMMSATSSWLRNDRPSDWWRTAFHMYCAHWAGSGVEFSEAASRRLISTAEKPRPSLLAILRDDEEEREGRERDHDQERHAPEDPTDQVGDHCALPSLARRAARRKLHSCSDEREF